MTNTSTATPTGTWYTNTPTLTITPTPLPVAKILLTRNLVNLSKSEKVIINIPEKYFGLDGKIWIYTRNGRLVKEMSIKLDYKIEWDGTNSSGHKVGSGIYIIRIKAQDIKEILKVVIIK